MPNVLDGLAHKLADAGLGAYSTTTALPADQTPISVAGMPGTDGAAYALSLYPGPETDSRNGWDYPRLQVRVRHVDVLQAMDMDKAAYDVLQTLGPEVLADGTNLQDCYSLQSGPMPIGQDGTGRWEFTRNYQLTLDK